MVKVKSMVVLMMSTWQEINYWLLLKAMMIMMMSTWQEINQIWAAVNELYGGLSASMAMPGWKMDASVELGNELNSKQQSPAMSAYCMR